MEKRNKNIFEFLEGDGLHLTWNPPKGPPTKQNFLKSGYLLRCYLTVRKGMEVKEKVFDVLSMPTMAVMRKMERSILHFMKRVITRDG
jgi:hypothetical protein